MKRKELKEAVDAKNVSTKEALELIISCITAKGQRKKITQNETARKLLDFYGVTVDE